MGCFERTPYVSVIACILVLTGSGVMCGTNYEAFRRTTFIFNERFYPIASPRIFQMIGIGYTVTTMLLSALNVSFGAMTTGDTRQKLYAHKKSQASGRSYSHCLSASTYLLTGAWVLLFIAFSVPVTLWTMLHRVCSEQTEYWRRISADKDETEFTYIFNLTNYGLYRRPLDTSLYSEYVNSPSAFTQLCQEISTVGPLFSIALLATLLVIMGLNCFIACLSSASTRLELSSDIDRVRRFPNMQDDIALPLITNQSQHSLSRSHLDIHPNVFSYAESISGMAYSRQTPVPGISAYFATDTSQRHTPVFRSTVRN